MPTKRRAPKRAEHPITPEAVAAFIAGDSVALHRALGLRPWQDSPLGVGDWKRPAWFNEADWNLQQALRAELIDAAGGERCR
jgi:hypothetical protein